MHAYDCRGCVIPMELESTYVSVKFMCCNIGVVFSMYLVCELFELLLVKGELFYSKTGSVTSYMHSVDYYVF